MTRRLWLEELHARWPNSFWDEFMRRPDVRLDRSCIRPEVSRTHTFGRSGVSNGAFFERHLRHIHLNALPMSRVDSASLLANFSKDAYDTWFHRQVYQEAKPVADLTRLCLYNNGTNGKAPVERFEYAGPGEFSRAARFLGLMRDFKEGVPRTAYRGVVSTFFQNRCRVYVAPRLPWAGYKPSPQPHADLE